MSYFGRSSMYVGDPGLFDTFKRIGGGIAKASVGFALGGPLGAAATLAPGAYTGGAQAAGRANQLFVPPTTGRLSPGTAVKLGAGLGGAAAGYANTRQMAPMAGGNGCPKGYQPAKVYVRGQGYQRIGHCVKIRKRNPYNRAAARRASGRLSSLGRGMKSIKKSVKSAARELS